VGDFSLLPSIHNGSGAHPAFCLVGKRSYFSGG